MFMSNNKKMLCCRILMIIFFPECYLKSTCESVSAFFPELRMSVFVSRPSQDADLIWAHQKLGGPPPPPPPPPASFFPFLKFFFLKSEHNQSCRLFFSFFPKSASVFRFLPVMHVFSVGLLFVLALFFRKTKFRFHPLKKKSWVLLKAVTDIDCCVINAFLLWSLYPSVHSAVGYLCVFLPASPYTGFPNSLQSMTRGL